MKRTTILADEPLLTEVKHLAAQQGKTVTAVVQEALREYVRTHQKPRQISFAGIGRSDDPAVARRDEEYLAAEVEPVGGWSPRRRPSQADDEEALADQS